MTKPNSGNNTGPCAQKAIKRLLDIMATLRSPTGCPWDAEQTPESLKPYIIEEAYEVIDAIDRNESGAIRDELGDLLLQIVFQSRIFEERGEFSLADVASAISDKLVRRHPHVFAGTPAGDAQTLADQWEAIKALENSEQGKPPRSLADIPRHLPALQMARKLAGKTTPGQNGGNPAGLLSESLDLLGQLGEEVRSSRHNALESRIGELLFSLARLGCALNIDLEQALRKTNDEVIAEHDAKFKDDRQER
ncbi:nucleoside triphosphate pyrophosphohydrolase [Trichloromonas sp.]|uniref:nucleoside triphosphate pyrophosphohydrolase n=1 Tax=Trichloromonas sp. TaxID=3069249 RepID=UPI003D819E9A